MWRIGECLQSRSEVACCLGKTKTKTGSYPGIETAEVAFVQPFLKDLMCALGKIISEANWAQTVKINRNDGQITPTKSSPTKSNVLSNRIISPTDKSPKRTVDKSISAQNTCLFLFFLRRLHWNTCGREARHSNKHVFKRLSQRMQSSNSCSFSEACVGRLQFY